MSKYTIKQLDRYDEKDYKLWRNGLKNFDGATIFHNPDFLGYHGDKFNEHHLGIFKGETLFGMMPMALFDENGKTVAKSPYGASFGGAIFMKILSYKEASEIVVEIINYLKVIKVKELIVTPPLDILYKEYSDTFIFALLEQGAKCINSDITNIVDIKSENIENVLTSSTRNKYKQALKKDFKIEKQADINDFYILMNETFQKHGTKPTHSVEEYCFIHDKFKKKFYCDIAYIENKPIAGIGYVLLNNNVKMSFYHVQMEELRNLHGLILLIVEALKECQVQNIKYYDFGTSSVNMKARANIFEFKEGFGAVGKFRHTYKLEIKG